MIRLLFILFVTVGGFAAAVLWNSRDRETRDVAQPVLPPELSAAVSAEVDRLGLPEAAARLHAAVTGAIVANPGSILEATDDQPKDSAAGTDSNSAPSPQAAETPTTAPQPGPPMRETEPGALVRSGAGGSLAPDDADDPESEVDDEVLTPPSEFARDLVPASEVGVESTASVIVDESRMNAPYRQLDEEPHDSDRSARLIRRMLALYRSTGARR